MTAVRPAAMADHPASTGISAEVGNLHARALLDRFQETTDPPTREHLRALADFATHGAPVAERGGAVVGDARARAPGRPRCPGPAGRAGTCPSISSA